MTAIATKVYDQEQSGRLVALIVVAVTAAVTVAITIYAMVAVFTKNNRPIHAVSVILILWPFELLWSSFFLIVRWVIQYWYESPSGIWSSSNVMKSGLQDFGIAVWMERKIYHNHFHYKIVMKFHNRSLLLSNHNKQSVLETHAI